ncbi:UDP-glucose 4-epimerase [Paenibacillus mucilaginosus 3016]|uniref:UDP-glucose 4-epimerase n=1 Tax=Paenibacillus mucilaginosus 3016 TaxID=1116391 RepID=H6NSX7_9BACL|nr:NAD-dependent epimerase/dehydratase family protein [Paenibacillus mucilaginosus]AFC27518.1 UDP-glucose 4-epimerase [Paenibacillus mucilaginosus 3016]WFA16416.1 NAD-dependent epimerase/dehydratase family protein [Paenibacillus mucilaginosus]
MVGNRCLLLGGGGFIGQNLTELLLDFGYSVTVFDRNLESKCVPLLKKVAYIEGDFFQQEHYAELLRNQDFVIHLISSVGPSSSMNFANKPYEQDVLKSIQLLDDCRKAGINRVIFLSSGGTVYGQRIEQSILKEDVDITNPINHYGIMKLTIEKIVLMYNELYNMENIVLRVANPYGKGQNTNKKIGAVSIFLDNILNNRPINLYGVGDTVRDYIDVSDVCEGIRAAINYQINDVIVPIFNIGTGKGYSLVDVIRLIEEVTQKKASIVFEEKRAIDVMYNVLDPLKSEKQLGFKANTLLSEGIRKLYAN